MIMMITKIYVYLQLKSSNNEQSLCYLFVKSTTLCFIEVTFYDMLLLADSICEGYNYYD